MQNLLAKAESPTNHISIFSLRVTNHLFQLDKNLIKLLSLSHTTQWNFHFQVFYIIF